MAAVTSDPLAGSARTDRVGAAFGVLAVVVSLGAIVGAISISMRFSFAANALSDLGRASWRSTAVFNAGVVIAGVFALLSGVVLARNANCLLHAAGSVAFSISAICLSLIGIFALPAPQHGTVAVGFFAMFTLSFFLFGAGDVRSGARRWGVFAVALGVLHVLGWAVWIGSGTPGGLALPELVGSGCVSVWILGTASRLWVRADG